MSLHWSVLRSKPNKEIALWRELTARGVECFYPHLYVRPVNPRSRTTRSYFPGYLFLHTNIEQMSSVVFKWMPFSSGLVSFDGMPATVPDNLIQAIRRHVDELNTARGKQFLDIKRGETVVIQSGPFNGYEAIFDKCLTGTERVRVFLKLLRTRQINLELPATQIQRKQWR